MIKTPSGWSINLLTFALLVITGLCSLGAGLAIAASQYGALTTRQIADEAQISALVIAVKETNTSIQALANTLAITTTLVNERTHSAEVQTRHVGDESRARSMRAEARQQSELAATQAAIRSAEARQQMQATATQISTQAAIRNSEARQQSQAAVDQAATAETIRSAEAQQQSDAADNRAGIQRNADDIAAKAKPKQSFLSKIIGSK